MGLKRMQVGGKYVLRIPSELGYGAEERGPIPANSDLTFDIEVLDLKTEAEVQAIVQQQQAIAADDAATGRRRRRSTPRSARRPTRRYVIRQSRD